MRLSFAHAALVVLSYALAANAVYALEADDFKDYEFSARNARLGQDDRPRRTILATRGTQYAGRNQSRDRRRRADRHRNLYNE